MIPKLKERFCKGTFQIYYKNGINAKKSKIKSGRKSIS